MWANNLNSGRSKSHLFISCSIIELFKIFVFLCVLFVLCRSVYGLCVNVYCTTATGWLPNCS